jgi:phage baseplate assembly protein W
MNVAYPLHFDSRGRSAMASDEEHCRQMLEQFLFTNPGERVNRPDFGSGMLQLIFAPNSPELAAALQFTMKAAIQKYLGDVISVQELEVSALDSTLNIAVRYSILPSGAVHVGEFSRTV